MRGRLFDLRVIFFAIAAAAAINGQKTAEIIAETFYQLGAGGEFDGATIFVNIGKWCAACLLRVGAEMIFLQ